MTSPKVKLKPVVRYTMSGMAESHSLTTLRTRDLMDVSDEPEERGGTNEGFAPTEYVLGGLVACTNVITHKIAMANGIEIAEMNIELQAQFNRLGVNLQEHVTVPFPAIHLRIELCSNATTEQQQTLKRDLAHYCAVSNILRQSGTDITEEWIFNRS